MATKHSPAIDDRGAAPSYRLEDFLRLDGEEFVRTAYRVLLRRPEVDPETLNRRLSELDSGKFTKPEILSVLSASAEGRSNGVDIEGVDATTRRMRLFNLPLIGGLLRWLAVLANLVNVERDLRAAHRAAIASLSAGHNSNREPTVGEMLSHLQSSPQPANGATVYERETFTLELASMRDEISQIRYQVNKRSRASEQDSALPQIKELGVQIENVKLEVRKKTDIHLYMDLDRRKADRTELTEAQASIGELKAAADVTQTLPDVQSIQTRVDELRSSIEGAVTAIQNLDQRKADLSGVTTLSESLTALTVSIDAIRNEQLLSAASVQALEHGKAELAGLTDLDQSLSAVKGTMESLQQEQLALVRRVLQQRDSLFNVERRLMLLLEEARKRFPDAISVGQVQNMVNQDSDLMSAMYASFEDVFRGSREDIKARLSVYVEKLRQSGIDYSAHPVLDIGCGRGEWLETLREQGLEAAGVDANSVMVERCRELGLNVTLQDAIAYLERLPANHLGAITGFHIVEHLGTVNKIRLFDEARRVLCPGGMFILETPNPNNVLVGSRTFYMDPTHVHPIPPPLLQFLVEARGFERVQVIELHPYPLSFHIAGSEAATRLNELFYGPQDYCVIGVRL